MNEGTIVYKGTSKSGKEFIIRYPTIEDAYVMSDYINTLSDEKTFITFQGEHMSVEDEREYLEKELKNVGEKKAVFLLAFSGETLVGISGIDLEPRTASHVGVFGISIAKDFRGDGVGKTLMEIIHNEAEKQIPALKIVQLGLFSGNDLARQMYEAYGYVEFGNLPEGIFYKGNYIDHIYMYKKIR